MTREHCWVVCTFQVAGDFSAANLSAVPVSSLEVQDDIEIQPRSLTDPMPTSLGPNPFVLLVSVWC